MVTALVLLNLERDKIIHAANKISAIDGVSEVFSVAGRYDLVAVIRARDNEHLADIVTCQMLMVEGIISSETLIAFKVYSKHDLESMFSIGT
jgi:DNA-binding Lrp family transcriptional regulator